MMALRNDSINGVLSVGAALAFALVWCLGAATSGCKPDPHAGHDHAAHAPGDPAADADEDEHAGPDDAKGHEDDVKADAHAGHDHAADGEEAAGLRLTAEQRERFGIDVRAAGPGVLRRELRLPGEIVFNEDRVVHMVPRVDGFVREVHTTLGGRVATGQVLAVIESRELADAKSAYLAGQARAALAGKYFAREKELHEKEISSEQDYLEAEQALAEARIELRAAKQKLHALGLSEDTVAALGDGTDETITRYEIRSPIDGIVTAKHMSLGESLEATSDILTVVDMSTVWVNLAVYTKNLGAVREGLEVMVRVDRGGTQARGVIAMVTPFVDEATRSATARVVLDNRDGHWVPGTFVTGTIDTSTGEAAIVIPRGAVQNIEGEDVVFVDHDGALEITPVTCGRSDRTHIEITAGLESGMRYVAEGAFEIKATVVTSSLDPHAGHGH